MTESLRICLHDFSGHPFQAELARRLADRGHEVVHTSSAQYVGGKGHLARNDRDNVTLSFEQLSLSRPFRKYSPLARVLWETDYARTTIDQLRRVDAEAFISCNIPLIASYRIARWARRRGLPWVFWHQDVYSLGIGDELRARLPGPLAKLGSHTFTQMEAYCARQAAHVVAIGDAFTETYGKWNVDPARVSVIPNWAPLDDIVPTTRDNHRSKELFDGEGLRLLYAGTLGRKHNPDLLVDLVRRLYELRIPASLTVVSEGESADYLARVSARHAELSIRVVPFQPAEELSAVLGSADVLLALLEPDATRFSIPSKVLSYLASGRPVLGLMPFDNPAAVDIVESGGMVVPPSPEGAASAASWLASIADSPASLHQIGARTRATAERKFDVATVTRSFEDILRNAVGRESAYVVN